MLQELATFTQSCKKCLTVIERNHQSVQKTMTGSKTLQHMDMGLLQKRVSDLQTSSQVNPPSPARRALIQHLVVHFQTSRMFAQAMFRESTEWRKHMEANSSLRKRFDESRGELEKVLRMAESCLTERGNPEELLKKHTVRKDGDTTQVSFPSHTALTVLLYKFSSQRADVAYLAVVSVRPHLPGLLPN